jgi:hypothetical protein
MIAVLVIFNVLAFLATILSIMENPKDEKQRGIGSITRIGWWLITLALVSLICSTLIAIDGNRQSNELDRQLAVANDKMDKQAHQLREVQVSLLMQHNSISMNHVAIDIPNWLFRFSEHARLDLGAMTLELATVPGGAYVDEQTYVKLARGQTIWAGVGQYNAVTKFVGSLQFDAKHCYGDLTGSERRPRIHLELSISDGLETTLPIDLKLEYMIYEEKLSKFKEFVAKYKRTNSMPGWPYFIYINRNRYYLLRDSAIVSSTDFPTLTLTYSPNNRMETGENR